MRLFIALRLRVKLSCELYSQTVHNWIPAGALPAGVTPVSKTLFINLFDTDFNLSATIPEKIEGLSWGPDLLGDCV